MKVSVLIPAYNQGHFLGHAIRSVLKQTCQDFEIIVVDDGSSDNTRQVALSFDEPRLHYLYQENQGLSAARNTGIRNSKGEYLTFLDSDDEFLPNKLAILTNELDQRPEIGFAAGQAVPIDENGQRIGEIFDTPLPENPANLLLENPLHVGSVMLRRTWQEKVGFFDERLRSYEDWDMWLRLALAGCRMVWVPQPVSYYRFHTAQMTRIGKQMTTATFAVLDHFFERPDLPDEWLKMKNRAYSSAYLRAAAQAYHARDYDVAKNSLRQAISLNPELSEDKGKTLEKIFRAWTDLPKISDPLEHLENIYNHLPVELESLSRTKDKSLGLAAVQLGFEAYQRGDKRRAKKSMVKAVRYWPLWLTNRGVLSVLLRSVL